MFHTAIFVLGNESYIELSFASSLKCSVYQQKYLTSQRTEYKHIEVANENGYTETSARHPATAEIVALIDTAIFWHIMPWHLRQTMASSMDMQHLANMAFRQGGSSRQQSSSQDSM